jgi:hypothetical protein
MQQQREQQAQQEEQPVEDDSEDGQQPTQPEDTIHPFMKQGTCDNIDVDF